jgi:hypothetical protein
MSQPATDRLKLKRVKSFYDDEPRYWHPNGWVIYRCTRDWSLRGMTRGASHQWSPKHWWEVKLKASTSRRREQFDTLRDARAWCDEHSHGWSASGDSGQA